ncbi:MAG: hypothetical protein S4CHLAM102_07630 [Chlamydiia bacterium]|nr:hypothetical protein [Chlamydiia bacterium]
MCASLVCGFMGNWLQWAWGGVIKIGLPVVAVYHIVSMSVFINTASIEAIGMERIANHVLAPAHYLMAAREVASLKDQPGHYQFTPRFNYDHYYVLNTAVSILSFPGSMINGMLIKGTALFDKESQKRYMAINHYLQSTRVFSNNGYYASIGMDVSEPAEDAWLVSDIYPRDVDAVDHLKDQKEALKEMMALLKKHDIVHWVNCGTCLGVYRHQGVIPWDEDIDLAILQPDFDNVMRALNELPKEKYWVQDWSHRSRPNSYIRVYIRETNSHIDIFHFSIQPEEQTISSILSYETSWFMPERWKKKERKLTVATPFETVFPLRRALFDGIEVYVPNHTKEYLQMRYGQDLRPARVFNPVTKAYEKDLSHPYWEFATK